MTPRELAILKKCKKSLPHYSSRALWIRTKSGGKGKLTLNTAQKYIHKKLQDQKYNTGRVRALILKGRQQGCSTYVEARFYHIASMNKGLRVFILTHEDEATKNLFEMAKRFHDNCPDFLKPSTKASNAKEILFDRLDSGYRVATAGTTGVGRSATFQLFHGSEVAFWPNADTHARGAMQAVPDIDGTEVILESTSEGPKGYFYQKWMDAEKGQNEYVPIFVPWFWQEEYKADAEGFEPSPEELNYQQEYGVTNEQLAWRRRKINALRADGQPGVYAFRREYPATPAEAFNAEVPGALWTRDLLNQTRVAELPPSQFGACSLDPATTSNKTSDDWGSISGVRGQDGHLYVYADDTLKASPKTIATNSVDRVWDDDLDCIIYETNQGGDMVPTIIGEVAREKQLEQVAASIPTKPDIVCHGVRASKGKRARAEPIALLHEQGKIHIVGELPLLEDELCTWRASSNESPNRLDAFVWLATELLLRNPCEASISLDDLTRTSPNIL